MISHHVTESITHPAEPALASPAFPTVESSLLSWDVMDTPSMRVSRSVPTRVQQHLTGNWQMGPESIGLTGDTKIAMEQTSPEALEKAEGDIEKAEDKCLHRLLVPRMRLSPLTRELAKVYPNSSIGLSGFFMYPDSGGYMGWHTNSDAPCTRLYITHVPEGGKSFFRYRYGGEYVTSWDEEGWNMREFQVTKDEPLWHCVYSDTKRMSVGFRINRNLKDLK